MQPPQHLPPDVPLVGKRIRGHDYRIGCVQSDAHEVCVGQKPTTPQLLACGSCSAVSASCCKWPSLSSSNDWSQSLRRNLRRSSRLARKLSRFEENRSSSPSVRSSMDSVCGVIGIFHAKGCMSFEIIELNQQVIIQIDGAVYPMTLDSIFEKSASHTYWGQRYN